MPTQEQASNATIPFNTTGTNVETIPNGPNANNNLGGIDGGPFDVAGNASHILVELRGSCTPAGSPCDLKVYLYDPSGHSVASTIATNGAGKLIFDGASPGTWGVKAVPKSAFVNARGEMRVTTFNGSVPDGYSAFQ